MEFENIEPIISLQEPTFNVEQIPEYTLIIEIGSTFFRFAIKHDERFIALEEYNYTDKKERLVFIKDLFNQHPFLSARFWKKIKLIVLSTKKTMVPCLLNEVESEKVWISMFGSKRKKDFLYTFSNQGNTLIYQANNSIINYFKDFYIEKEILILPIEAALFKMAGFSVLHFDGNSWNISFKETFHISYYHKDWRVLTKLSNDSNLVLTGEITEYASEYRELKAAKISTEMAVLDKNIQLSRLFNELPIHRYFIIFNI